jgi:hypothetical protein
MFYAVIVGLAGALIMFAGDMLLYYTPEDFAYDSKLDFHYILFGCIVRNSMIISSKR